MTAEDWPLWRYRGRVVSVTDGDTLVIAIDVGFRVTQTIEIRLLRINAPEMHKPTLAQGKASRDYLALLVEGRLLYIQTEKDHRSFTRYLGDIWIKSDQGGLVNVNDLMVERGFAVSYDPS